MISMPLCLCGKEIVILRAALVLDHESEDEED
jgi:hypothetical protein